MCTQQSLKPQPEGLQLTIQQRHSPDHGSLAWVPRLSCSSVLTFSWRDAVAGPAVAPASHPPEDLQLGSLPVGSRRHFVS